MINNKRFTATSASSMRSISKMSDQPTRSRSQASPSVVDTDYAREFGADAMRVFVAIKGLRDMHGVEAARSLGQSILAAADQQQQVIAQSVASKSAGRQSDGGSEDAPPWASKMLRRMADLSERVIRLEGDRAAPPPIPLRNKFAALAPPADGTDRTTVLAALGSRFGGTFVPSAAKPRIITRSSASRQTVPAPKTLSTDQLDAVFAGEAIQERRHATLFLEGVPRRRQGEIRAAMRTLGVDTRKVRDIAYPRPDVMAVVVFAEEREAVQAALTRCGRIRAVQFDPLAAPDADAEMPAAAGGSPLARRSAADAARESCLARLRASQAHALSRGARGLAGYFGAQVRCIEEGRSLADLLQPRRLPRQATLADAIEDVLSAASREWSGASAQP
jgi:hypothetical protein